MNLYYRLHGSKKSGTDIFIEHMQLQLVSLNLMACILIENRKCIIQPDIKLVPPHVGILFDPIKQLLNIVLSCYFKLGIFSYPFIENIEGQEFLT